MGQTKKKCNIYYRTERVQIIHLAKNSDTIKVKREERPKINTHGKYDYNLLIT